MGKGKVILTLIIAIAIVGAGAMFYLKQGEAETSEKASAEETAALSVDTDVITTNLASEDNYAVVQFNILLGNEKAKEELEKRHPEVRAAVIATVAGFTKKELAGTKGIGLLEKEVTKKLDEIVQNGRVERVLVTEFKLQ